MAFGAEVITFRTIVPTTIANIGAIFAEITVAANLCTCTTGFATIRANVCTILTCIASFTNLQPNGINATYAIFPTAF